ncbi:MAG: hypothetical protein BAA02_01925 [Paenibacillaceae bacterium ZCTH02-B3]|nr:MAG: hypothetical protein BAA02_01925 [Paenibacillaceae bacterium ZCTH02-B3]
MLRSAREDIRIWEVCTLRALMRLLIPLLAILLVYGCETGRPPSGTEPSSGGRTESGPPASPSVSMSAEEASLLEAAGEVVRALRDRDLDRLAYWVHEERGVLFSPHRRMDPAASPTFLPGELPQFSEDAKIAWGIQEGTGNAIELSFREYFETFVYDEDFAQAPAVSVNRPASPDDSPYNGQEIFPGSSYVEYYFPRQESRGGAEWKSLILVFLPADGEWRLVAVAHGEG